jgi:hypothetical protein
MAMTAEEFDSEESIEEFLKHIEVEIKCLNL